MKAITYSFERSASYPNPSGEFGSYWYRIHLEGTDKEALLKELDQMVQEEKEAIAKSYWINIWSNEEELRNIIDNQRKIIEELKIAYKISRNKYDTIKSRALRRK